MLPLGFETFAIFIAAFGVGLLIAWAIWGRGGSAR